MEGVVVIYLQGSITSSWENCLKTHFNLIIQLCKFYKSLSSSSSSCGGGGLPPGSQLTSQPASPSFPHPRTIRVHVHSTTLARAYKKTDMTSGGARGGRWQREREARLEPPPPRSSRPGHLHGAVQTDKQRRDLHGVRVILVVLEAWENRRKEVFVFCGLVTHCQGLCLIEVIITFFTYISQHLQATHFQWPW